MFSEWVPTMLSAPTTLAKISQSMDKSSCGDSKWMEREENDRRVSSWRVIHCF